MRYAHLRWGERHFCSQDHIRSRRWQQEYTPLRPTARRTTSMNLNGSRMCLKESRALSKKTCTNFCPQIGKSKRLTQFPEIPNLISMGSSERNFHLLETTRRGRLPGNWHERFLGKGRCDTVRWQHRALTRHCTLKKAR